MNIIKDNDWERAEIFLKKVFYENPENIVGHVEEFIELWCGVCTGLLEKAQTKKLVPIFLQMFVMIERNQNFNKLITRFFDNFGLDEIISGQDEKNKILLRLGYSQYCFLKGDFSEAEKLAYGCVLDAKTLIKDEGTRDLGWLIVRRSLALGKRKHASRKVLSNFIASLED